MTSDPNPPDGGTQHGSIEAEAKPTPTQMSWVNASASAWFATRLEYIKSVFAVSSLAFAAMFSSVEKIENGTGLVLWTLSQLALGSSVALCAYVMHANGNIVTQILKDSEWGSWSVYDEDMGSGYAVRRCSVAAVCTLVVGGILAAVTALYLAKVGVNISKG